MIKTTIKAVGTVKITNADNGSVTYSATYDAKEILDALHNGESIHSIIHRLDGSHVIATQPSPNFN